MQLLDALLLQAEQLVEYGHGGFLWFGLVWKQPHELHKPDGVGPVPISFSFISFSASAGWAGVTSQRVNGRGVGDEAIGAHPSGARQFQQREPMLSYLYQSALMLIHV